MSTLPISTFTSKPKMENAGFLIGISYVPDYVLKSKWFWILLSIVTVCIIIYHNLNRRYTKNKKMTESLKYQTEGRGGVVIYSSSSSTLRFQFEFGGGNCVAIIFIPSTNEWESETGRSIDERQPILEFVARQALQDQASDGWFEIKDQYIELYKKE